MRPRRILFVAMQHSIHVARWIELAAKTGMELHLFCVDQGEPNPDLQGVTLHMPRAVSHSAPRRFGPRALLARVLEAASKRFGAGGQSGQGAPGNAIRNPGLRMIEFQPETASGGGVPDNVGSVEIGADRRAPALHGPEVLNALIDRLQPDLIHSMEFQLCGYLTLSARERATGRFPGWLATNWGSDIFLFGRQPEHAVRIRALLAAADLYSCECRRDIELARQFGFVGPELPVLPNSGGFDIAKIARLRSSSPPSARKLIMVKGYQHFAGRAMTSLRVLESFANKLKGFEVVVYSCSAEPRARALELKDQGVLDIRVIDWATHDEVLEHFGRARMYMGISLSDAISTSVLEAMAMGAFPIQTNTSCCDEWFVDGETGFIVDPGDFEAICDRFERALTDDALVDRAATINLQTIESRLDNRLLQPRVSEFYGKAFDYLEALALR